MVDVLHSVAEALKGLLSWKSGKGFLLPFPPSLHLKESGAVQLLFASPLDRIRSGGNRRERVLQLGLNVDKESFDGTQAFVRNQKSSQVTSEEVFTGKLCTMDKFRGDALNTFSFSPGHSRGSFAKTPDSTSRSVSFSDSWTFFNMMSNGQVGNGGIPSNIYNPNKAVVTIDAKSSEILVANDMACRLFGYNSEELCKRRLADLFKNRHNQKTIVETHLETTGQLVLVSGKVVDVMDSDGDVIPVSLWVKKLDTVNESRCLAVMEPVERTCATFTFDSNGTILACDKTLAMLHGYTSECDVEGLNVQTLIPSFILPKESQKRYLPRNVKKQQATGRTRDGATFPLSLVIEFATENEHTHFCCNDKFASTDLLLDRLIADRDISATSLVCEAATSQPNSSVLSNTYRPSDSTSDFGECSLASTPDDDSISVYTAIVWVFANISGMITILPDGTIHSCNHYFALMLLGYSQSQLVGKNISSLIPTFYDDLEFLESDSLQMPPYDDDDDLAQYSPNNRDAFSADADCWPENGFDHESTLEARSPSSGLREVTDSLRHLSFLRSSEKEACFAHVLNKYLQEKEENSEKLWQMFGIEFENNKRIDVTNQRNDLVQETCNLVCDVNGNNDRGILSNDSESHQLTDSAYGGSGDTTSINLTQMEPDNKLSASNDDPNAHVNPRHLKAMTNAPSVKHANIVRSKSAQCFGDGDTRALQGAASDEETPLGSCSSNTITDNSDKNINPINDDSALASSPTEKFANRRLFTHCPPSISEGSFFGLGRHRDGSDLRIIYQIKRVNLDDGQVLYCLWVSRDPDEPAEGGRPVASLTLASSVNSTLDASASSISLGQIINDKCNVPEASQIMAEHSELEFISGPYAEKYVTLQQIGKGAFGCVKMAYRNSDKLLVITKFIRKAEVYDECWVDDNVLKKTVPLEVSLLTTLKHPNIVQVLDVFENADYFQMVMEKHGCGMDLFEFIDRGPNLDEPLSSYIFRQVVSAVGYLHSLNILHRDIKDENIILDECFHVKLIDFGSATFMAPGKLFSTFCGTVEYCSPEVLQGNKYRGPELEMWSLGVTFYTLIFGENPFFDIDEIIKAVLRPPFQASKELTLLISGLLDADPVTRFTLRELEANEWLHQRVAIENYNFNDVINCSAEEANPPRYYFEMENRSSDLDHSFDKFHVESFGANAGLLADEEVQEA